MAGCFLITRPLGALGLCCTDGHFFAKTRPFHFPISKIFACGAQKLDLAYVYVVSVAGRWRIRMDAARNLLLR